ASLVLKKELINAQLQSKLGRDVDNKIAKCQREHYLMEQLKGIKKELGMESGGKDKLIKKFKEWAISWGKHTPVNYSIVRAQKVLDEDHCGLKTGSCNSLLRASYAVRWKGGLYVLLVHRLLGRALRRRWVAKVKDIVVHMLVWTSRSTYRVLFIYTVPAPLLDRIEVLETSGYISEKTAVIAQGYLDTAGLRDADVELDREAVDVLIEYYCQESGVRSLKKLHIQQVLLNLTSDLFGRDSVTLGHQFTRRIGCTLRYPRLVFVLDSDIGDGSGAVMPIEAMGVSGRRAEHVYGFLSLFEMLESIPILSIIMLVGIGDSNWLTLALCKIAGYKEARMAMTGEISLVGQLPSIGGLKEKILAAHCAGIKTIIASAANRADIEENVAYPLTLAPLRLSFTNFLGSCAIGGSFARDCAKLLTSSATAFSPTRHIPSFISSDFGHVARWHFQHNSSITSSLQHETRTFTGEGFGRGEMSGDREDGLRRGEDGKNIPEISVPKTMREGFEEKLCWFGGLKVDQTTDAVLNTGLIQTTPKSSQNWQDINLMSMIFPAEFLIDYVRVYQRKDSVNYGCDPKDFPTLDYINAHLPAYQNINLTSWPYPKPRNSLYSGGC
ncbi:SKN1-domain-containing protein, partial [Pluteus cervinus]